MRRFVILVVLMIIACLMTAGLVRPQSAGQGKGSEKAGLAEARGEVAVAVLNGKIYVLGGSARGRDDQQLVEEYDPATDRWRERAPMPRGLSHAGVVGMNGKIYVAGGFTRNVHMGALDVAFEYDPASEANANTYEEPAGLGWSGCTQRKDLRDWRTWRRYGDGLN